MTLLERLKGLGACERGLRAIQDLSPEEREALERDFLAREIRISSLPKGLLGYLSWALAALGPEYLDRDQTKTEISALSLAGEVSSLDFSDSLIEDLRLLAANASSFTAMALQSIHVSFRASWIEDGLFCEARVGSLYINFSHVLNSSFRKARLGQVRVGTSYLSSISFTRSRIKELCVEGSSIDGASFSEARVRFDAVRTKLSGCYLGGARISGTFRYCQFSDVHWPEDLSQVKFINCQGAPK